MNASDESLDGSQSKQPPVISLTRNPEGLLVFGHDNSQQVFPHLGLTWDSLKKIATDTGKPVADCGAAYSTVPVEAQLMGIDVIPIDVMWPTYEVDYDDVVGGQMEKAEMIREFTGDTYYGIKPIHDLSGNYFDELPKATKAVKQKYLHADLAKIPRPDRAFSVCLVHDAIPKHSADVDEFIDGQLPELLRVTDQAVYVYPMGIYKPMYYHEEYDDEENQLIWREIPFPGEWNFRNNRKFYQVEYKEAVPLYGEDAQDITERIRSVAAKHGFTFTTEQAKHFDNFHNKLVNDSTYRGIFTRNE